jgi:hypothetical protein
VRRMGGGSVTVGGRPASQQGARATRGRREHDIGGRVRRAGGACNARAARATRVQCVGDGGRASSTSTRARGRDGDCGSVRATWVTESKWRRVDEHRRARRAPTIAFKSAVESATTRGEPE